MQKHFPYIEVDLSALSYNLKSIKQEVGKKVKIAGVVKANAYGHGMVLIAQYLEKQKIDYLCVSRITEALRLREQGLKKPILVLSYTPAYYFKDIIQHDITVTIRSLDVAKSLVTEARRKNKIVKVHVKVETGMHRIGVETPQILFFLKKILDLPNLEIEGLYTHFSDIDDVEFSKVQLERFQKVIDELEKAQIKIPIIHAANSGAIFSLPESFFTMVRSGIALLGLSPFSWKKDVSLKPVLSLKTKVIQVKKVPEEEYIGYGRTFKTQDPTVIATIAIGYGDGVRRGPNKWKEVLINGQRCPIIGRVAMDACQIDVSNCSQVQVGDTVVLIGQSGDEIITADDIAKTIGTNNYEVVTALTERVERVYKK